MNETFYISIKISLKIGTIDNIVALVQVMAWRRTGGKPLSEPMMTQIYVAISRYQAPIILSLT